jgi:hypothetical protein
LRKRKTSSNFEENEELWFSDYLNREFPPFWNIL